MKIRYDRMIQLYPWLGELFAQIADRIHAGESPEMAMQHLEQCDLRLAVLVTGAHRPAITEKLECFAQVAHSNRQYIIDNEEPAEIKAPQTPVRCPYCSSIETDGDTCRWCRNQIAG